VATKTTRFGQGNIDPQRWDRLKTILGEALEQDSSAARIALVERRAVKIRICSKRRSRSWPKRRRFLRSVPTASKIAPRTQPPLSGRRDRRAAESAWARMSSSVNLAAVGWAQFSWQSALMVNLRNKCDQDTESRRRHAEILRRFRAERQILAKARSPKYRAAARCRHDRRWSALLHHGLHCRRTGDSICSRAKAVDASTTGVVFEDLRPRWNLRIGIWLFIATSSPATFWRTQKGSRSCSISGSPSSWRKTKTRRN
jgi:hypothetical protein